MPNAKWEDGWTVSNLMGRDYLDVRGSVVFSHGRYHAFSFAQADYYVGDFASRASAKRAVEGR